jgi:hypothetical protein
MLLAPQLWFLVMFTSACVATQNTVAAVLHKRSSSGRALLCVSVLIGGSAFNTRALGRWLRGCGTTSTARSTRCSSSVTNACCCRFARMCRPCLSMQIRSQHHRAVLMSRIVRSRRDSIPRRRSGVSCPHAASACMNAMRMRLCTGVASVVACHRALHTP